MAAALPSLRAFFVANEERRIRLPAETPDEADAVIAQAWEVHDRPVLMEFVVPNEEMVFPMVPAGAATDNMILKRFAPGE